MNYLKQIQFSPIKTQFFTHKRLVSISHLNHIPHLNQYTILQSNLVQIFINPNILSYSIIDNIIDLSHYFDKFIDISIKFNQLKVLKPKQLYTFSISNSTQFILNLHHWNIYQPKFQQHNYRGGKRFIFKSESLASHICLGLRNFLPKQMNIKFHSVNQIFRFNWFQSNDNKFQQHYDVPYVNKSKCIESRYSLLIYLSKGRGNPVLSIQQIRFDKIEVNECILFSQKMKHEGNAYEDGDKFFIRTQLLYEVEYNNFSDQASKWFNSGCYISKQSIIDDSLIEYSSKCFKYYVQCKNKINSKYKPKKLYLHKKSKVFFNNQQIENLQFITDGTTFYFSKTQNLFISIAIIIYDYFSGPAINQTIDKYILHPQDNQIQLFSPLISQTSKLSKINQLSTFQLLKHNKLVISQKPTPKYIKRLDYQCSQHQIVEFQKYYKQVVNGFYLKFNQFKNPEASFIILGQNYILNLNDIIVSKNKIYFKNSDAFHNFNFAGCYCSQFSYHQFLLDYHPQNMSYESYNLPYINYQEKQKLHVFNIDMFHNGYVILNNEDQTQVKGNKLVKYIDK